MKHLQTLMIDGTVHLCGLLQDPTAPPLVCAAEKGKETRQVFASDTTPQASQRVRRVRDRRLAALAQRQGWDGGGRSNGTTLPFVFP
jgi:hypothetical protein